MGSTSLEIPCVVPDLRRPLFGRGTPRSLPPGQPIRFRPTGGERHDRVEAEALLKDLSSDDALADQAYDRGPLRKTIRRRGAQSVIPAR
ncbi:MAG TPA: hypothetical protein EYP14_14970, partial [Planctomycetaceae bacterium]|nr:hypothetical protein [Planctomycetaceae bacterium]